LENWILGKQTFRKNGFREIGFRKIGLLGKRNSEKQISGD